MRLEALQYELQILIVGMDCNISTETALQVCRKPKLVSSPAPEGLASPPQACTAITLSLLSTWKGEGSPSQRKLRKLKRVFSEERETDLNAQVEATGHHEKAQPNSH